MTEYLLKSSVALAVAYLLYFVFARKNTNFRWLRLYFLTAIAISLILPALKYLPDFHRHDLVSVPAKYIPAWIEDSQVIMVDVPQTALVKAQPPAITLSEIIRYLYGLGAIVLFIRFFIGLSQLVWMVWRNGVQRKGKDYFVLVPELAAPFSFFQFIFIDCQYLSTDEHEPISQHERAHVRHWHTVDLLLLEFITMAFWFNPFAWFIRRTLKEIHEFQADEATVRKHISPLDYQHLLLSQVCGVKIYLPANGFNSSLTKKRILMITNNKQNRKWMGIFTLLVIVFLSIDSLSRINAAQQFIKNSKAEIIKTIASIYSPQRESVNKNSEVAINVSEANASRMVNQADITSAPASSDSAHKTVIVKTKSGNYAYDGEFLCPALFKGTTTVEESQIAYRKFIKENLKYPEELKDKVVIGYVCVHYDIDENGKVLNVRCANDETRNYYKNADEKYKDQPEKLERIKQKLSLYTDNPLLVKEALRIFSLLPDYTAAKNKEGKYVKSSNSYEVFFMDPKDAQRNNSYRDYIEKNRRYPQEAITRKAEGTVCLAYDLTKDGKYGNIKVNNNQMRTYYEGKGLYSDSKKITDDPALIKEAIRLLKERPGYYIENMDTTRRAMFGSCSIDFYLPK